MMVIAQIKPHFTKPSKNSTHLLSRCETAKVFYGLLILLCTQKVNYKKVVSAGQPNPTQPNPTHPNPTQQPTLCWIFIMLRGISCAYLDNECVGVINIGEREANIIKLMGEKVTEIYCIK
jgi:hypothetical protein